MAELLPLYPGAKPCQRSGWCCEQGACPFGTWDSNAHKCTELSYDSNGLAQCAKFDEITSKPQGVWWMAPAFGAGCCASMNPKRHR